MNAKYQKGMATFGWLLTIILVGFILTILIKLIPVYLDRFTVSSVMSTIENETAVKMMDSDQIANLIVKRLKKNYVDDILKEDIYIRQVGNNWVIELDYDIRRNLLGNHDIIVHYTSRIEVPAQ